MKQVNIHQAKTHLSRLLESVEAGEEIVIARSGVPIARLTPYAPAATPRQPGALKGRIDRKSTRLNSSHNGQHERSRMPSSA